VKSVVRKGLSQPQEKKPNLPSFGVGERSMRKGDRLLTATRKGFKDRLVLILGVAIGSYFDGVFAEATTSMFCEICSGVFVALIEEPAYAPKIRFAVSCCTGEEVAWTSIDPLHGNIRFEEGID
jgi:hypothetical protein